jgi:hypothetical protein
MCIQDFVELLTLDLRKMTRKEKQAFRNGWLRQMRRRMAIPKVGQFVIVQMDDGRKIEAVVKAVHQTTSGEKVQIAFGNCTAKVGVEQILKQR